MILVASTYYFYIYPYTISEKTPFINIEWKGEKVFVEINKQNFEWLSSEGESIEKIQTFAKNKYRDKWKHRLADDYILVLRDMGHWTFFSTRMKLRDSSGNEINKRIPLSSENREKTRNKISENKRIKRKHNTVIPDSLAYITHRVDGYRPSKNAKEVKKDIFEYNLSLPMDSWVPRAMAVEDLESLEYEIKNNFSYADLKGINYPIVIDAIIADIKNGISKRDLGIQIKRLLALFGDGHSRVSRSMLKLDSLFLPFTIQKLEDKYIALTENKLYDTDYPEIITIDRFAIDSLKEKAGEMVAKGSPQFYENNCLTYLSYYGHLKSQLGLEGISISMQLSNGKDTISKSIELVGRDVFVKNFRNKNSQHKLLENNIGYIYLHKMENTDDYQEWLRTAMDEFKNTDGLIIDIRGNGGGSRKPIYTLLPYFLRSPKVININVLRIDKENDPDVNEPIGQLEKRMSYPEKSIHWTSEEQKTIALFKQHFKAEWNFDKNKFSKWHYSVVSPNGDYYNKPVVILMDENNFSASDIFLGAFKGSRNITLLGSKSGGGSGFANLKFLYHSGIMYLLSRMASFQPNGKLYDGNGILPDKEIRVTLNDIKTEKDVVLETAFKTIAK